MMALGSVYDNRLAFKGRVQHGWICQRLCQRRFRFHPRRVFLTLNNTLKF